MKHYVFNDFKIVFMDTLNQSVFVMLPQEQWEALQSQQKEIYTMLQELHSKGPGGIPVRYITAQAFMEQCGIHRSKFDELRRKGMIRVIKKKRKLYLPINEVERFYTDNNIQ